MRTRYFDERRIPEMANKVTTSPFNKREITGAEMEDEIVQFKVTGMKTDLIITSIKFIRFISGLGLKESKAIIDAAREYVTSKTTMFYCSVYDFAIINKEAEWFGMTLQVVNKMEDAQIKED